MLSAAGLRVVAPDLIGFGRSDKPAVRTDCTYARHVEWLRSLLFDHLDFEFITSAAFTDNPASLRVSEKLGYRDNGISWSKPRGTRAVTRRLLLLPEDFVRGEPITVEGIEPLRRFIGLDA